MLIFVVLGLLLCSEAKETPVFKRTGTDLLLDVKKTVTLEEGDDLTWTVNGTTNTVKLFSSGKSKFFGNFESRAGISAQNYFLLLKKVQPSDSGVYIARVNSAGFTDVAKYKLTVQDPVSRVELMVKSCSSDWSNLTVICRTLDSNISSMFTCRNQTCSHEGGERTTPGAPLDVYLENGSVICYHSNQVSSEEDAIKTEDLCGETPESHSGSGLSLGMLRIIMVTVSLFIMVCAVISVHVFERLKKKG